MNPKIIEAILIIATAIGTIVKEVQKKGGKA